MNDRGQYGDRWGFCYGYASPRMMIGLSPESLKGNLERLNDEVRSLYEKINIQIAEEAMQAPGQTPLMVFTQKKWAPFVRSWRDYYDKLKDISVFVWLAIAKDVENKLSDWQGKLIDMRVEASLAGLKTNGAPAPTPAPPPGPAPGPTPAPARFPMSVPAPQFADQLVTPDKEKSSNVGLYVALGLGAVAAVAAVMAFHTEAA